tara:strand:- start:387 stop:1181 length:795 start_codon:yes stop_codon:yes gene_type:complete
MSEEEKQRHPLPSTSIDINDANWATLDQYRHSKQKKIYLDSSDDEEQGDISSREVEEEEIIDSDLLFEMEVEEEVKLEVEEEVKREVEEEVEEDFQKDGEEPIGGRWKEGSQNVHRDQEKEVKVRNEAKPQTRDQGTFNIELDEDLFEEIEREMEQYTIEKEGLGPAYEKKESLVETLEVCRESDVEWGREVVEERAFREIEKELQEYAANTMYESRARNTMSDDEIVVDAIEAEVILEEGVAVARGGRDGKEAVVQYEKKKGR